jgi:hypothetical protein
MDFYAKYEQLMKKHGIKLAGAWSGTLGSHFNLAVFETPTMEALMKFKMEPEVMKVELVQTIELHPLMTLEEIAKLMK